MSRSLRIISAGVVGVFAVISLLSLRADIARISFAPFWQSWNLLILAVALTFLNYTLRISRWRWYLTRSGHPVALGFAALTYIAGFAFTLTPGKLGELMKARYYTAIGIPLRDVVAAFSVERLMDLLALLALTFLIWSKLPHFRGLVYAAGAALAVGTGLLVLLPSEATPRYFKFFPKVPRRLERVVASGLSLLKAARSLLSVRTALFGFVVAVLAWGFEGLGLGVLASIFSPVHNEPAICVGIYAVSVLLGALSFLPGGIGSTETVMTALLVGQGSSLGAAVLTTLACRLTTLWLGVSLGWTAVAVLRNSLQQSETAAPAMDD
jgi:uncharacterized protein (TIRG00374 family)